MLNIAIQLHIQIHLIFISCSCSSCRLIDDELKILTLLFLFLQVKLQFSNFLLVLQKKEREKEMNLFEMFNNNLLQVNLMWTRKTTRRRRRQIGVGPHTSVKRAYKESRKVKVFCCEKFEFEICCRAAL